MVAAGARPHCRSDGGRSQSPAGTRWQRGFPGEAAGQAALAKAVAPARATPLAKERMGDALCASASAGAAATIVLEEAQKLGGQAEALGRDLAWLLDALRAA